MVQSGNLASEYPNSYCKINKNNKDKPSYFEMEILLDNEVFSYGFEIILSKNILVSEWLIKLGTNEETPLFYKDGENDSYHFGDILKDNNALDIYQQGILGTNTLFLTEMNKNKTVFYSNNTNAVILEKIYDWICNKLEIVFPPRPTKQASFMVNTTSLDKVAQLLHSFGTGIVKINEIPEDINQITKNFPYYLKEQIAQHINMIQVQANKDYQINKGTDKYTFIVRSQENIIGIEYSIKEGFKSYSIQFEHENIDSDVLFKVSEESDGTIRLFELIEVLLNTNKTYVIDELDRCLHPCLTYNFIKKFFEYSDNKEVQLIVTTHEPKLMDLKLLRRDEIWFVDKDKQGNSNIYSLEEYNTRFDQKVDKAYLEGRYGGVPSFDTMD